MGILDRYNVGKLLNEIVQSQIELFNNLEYKCYRESSIKEYQYLTAKFLNRYPTLIHRPYIVQ